MRVNRGFTLIELLIVIVIIGIVSGATLYAFGDFGTSRKATAAAEQLQAYIKLIQQQAILESNALGVSIAPYGYNSFRLQEGKTWQPMPERSIFHWRTFPKNIKVQLLIPKHHADKQPDIIILPSGDMTVFSIDFGSNANPKIIKLMGRRNGDTEVVNYDKAA